MITKKKNKNNKLSVFSWLLPLITVGMLIGLVACPSDSGSSGNDEPRATLLTVLHSVDEDNIIVTVALDDRATLSGNLDVIVMLTPTSGTPITRMVMLDTFTDSVMDTIVFTGLAVGVYTLSATATDAQFTYAGGSTIDSIIEVRAPLATLGMPSSASIAEDGSDTATVVVSLSRAPADAVTVLVHVTPAPDAGDYAVSPSTGITLGTATSSALPVMIAIDASNLTRTLTIAAAEDADGTSESLAIALQFGTGYTIGTANDVRTIAINDNEPPASLGTPSRATIVEGATDGSASATIEVSLTPAPAAPIDLQLNISPAPVAGDYSVTTGAGVTLGTAAGGMLPVTVRLDASNPTRTLTIGAANDDDDIAEDLTIALQPADGYRIDSGSGAEQSLAINDIPLISCLFRNAADMVTGSVNEDVETVGIRFVLPATIDPDATFVHAGSSLRIRYNVAGGATNPIVAADLGSGFFGDAIEATRANARIKTLGIVDDSLDEPSETLLVTLLPNTTDEYAYRLSATPTCELTIEDND